MKQNQRERVSREAASKAGKCLKNSNGQDEQALATAQAWRVQHLEPTARCFEALTRCAEQFDGAVVSYRLKRMNSILRKLLRLNSNFKLGTLDDIGGCRLIVSSVDEVYRAVGVLNDELGEPKIKDYISSPQSSGYRSYHAIYQIPERGISYRIEVQIRTHLQHLWATGVEAVGEVYGLEYKSPDVRASLEGEAQKRDRFLMLSSHLFAREEGRPGVPDVADDLAVVRHDVGVICESTHLLDDLRAARSGIVVQTDSDQKDEYFLLCLSREIQFFNIVGFPEFEAANEEYQRLEKESLRTDSGNDITIAEPEFDNVVLVKAESAEAIKSSYLNYSLGVEGFIRQVEQLSGLSLS
jgi:hypothetical protein